ncbi:protein of unknown function [Chryseobacterium sp. JV274]|nr:protein of unknown function [Chryseobacterium sp. JV274]
MRHRDQKLSYEKAYITLTYYLCANNPNL